MAEPGSPDATGPSAADPIRQLVDLFVYTPIGLLTMVQKDLPQIIATGKTRLDNQLTMAKFIGTMAVRQLKGELDRRLDEAEKARCATSDPAKPGSSIDLSIVPDDIDIDVIADVVADVVADLVVGLDVVAPESLPEAIIEAVIEAELSAAPNAEDLPIAGYESLAASQVVLRLGSLTPAELEAVGAYETTHRARRTILGKIHQLQAQ